MDTWVTMVIAVGLGLDALAVSLGIGGKSKRLYIAPTLRLSFSFGFFQFFMCTIGWYAGAAIVQWIAQFDHWVAFAVLTLVGIKMIREGFAEEEERENDPTRGWTLILLSLATSIDSLAVGFSFALIKIAVWTPAIIIGVVCFFMTAFGLVFGRILGHLFGRKVEILGGLVLIAIGVKILLEHLPQ